MRLVSQWTIVLCLSFAALGCSSRNYDFSSVADRPDRVPQLAQNLKQVKGLANSGDEELYAITVMPLVCSHLHVFSESYAAESPARFVEAKIDTRLPLLSFVDATYSEYDQGHRLLTRHEIDSDLWGAFRRHRETTVNDTGQHETVYRTVFWFFSWEDQPDGHPVGEEVARIAH